MLKGMVPTLLREGPSYAGQFYVYELLKEMLAGDTRAMEDLGSLELMFCGGLAGIAAWVKVLFIFFFSEFSPLG